MDIASHTLGLYIHVLVGQKKAMPAVGVSLEASALQSESCRECDISASLGLPRLDKLERSEWCAFRSLS